MSNITIRNVKETDVDKLLEIYSYYVLNTAITFDYNVPTREEFLEKIKTISARYPYLVAEKDGELLGYCYAHQFIARAAYDWSAETTIYLKHTEKRQGLGRRFYDELEKRLKKQGVLNMNACITYPTKENPYVTMDSVNFHTKMGFENCGHFHNSGYKFGQWYDMVWMEKMIGEHTETPAPFTLPESAE